MKEEDERKREEEGERKRKEEEGERKRKEEGWQELMITSWWFISS